MTFVFLFSFLLFQIKQSLFLNIPLWISLAICNSCSINFLAVSTRVYSS